MNRFFNKFFFSLFACATVLFAASVMAAETTGVTIAVTGDVYTPDVKVVSDAILAHPEVAAVLIAGDTDNAKATPLESYQKVYKGTYDRFWDKIYPCPGNHDSLSKPHFSGYLAFWGAKAHGPEMYYSFDLGGWHIVNLDSVTFVLGGEQAAKQLAWLKKDLAANPNKPVIAQWHFPYFSHAKHLGQPKMKPFMEALYAHGPAIVITGHNHVYERFAPMNPDGKVVAENKGVQHFQVCPGGAKPITVQDPKSPGPASLKFHGGTHHVGYFTLYPDGGYHFTIDAIDSKGAVTLVDTGSGNLLGGPIPRNADLPGVAQ